MSKMDKLKEIIRELIQQELREATVTGAIDGGEGSPKTPKAFGNKKKKKKEISTNSTGYNVVKEALNETPQMAKQGQVGLLLKLANKQLQDVFSLHKKGKNKEAKVVFNNKVYSTLEYIHRAFDNVSESVNEGKYHDYRNDESMTPKQKIGRSMREVRDGLNNLEKLVKMNVRLKNELNVNSGSYWKNTHKALHKISERLVKLANKVGQLQ
jgi:hypothetical protein